jgi:hypothetical protein
MNLLRKMPFNTHRQGQKALASSAYQFMLYWKRAVRGNTLGLAKKAPVTIEAEGGKTIPLIWRQWYVRGIKKTPPGNRSDYYLVGVDKSRKHPVTGLNVATIAMFNEYGAVIRPKKAKSIAIPVTKKARRFTPRKYPWKAGKPIFIPFRQGKRSKVFGGLFDDESRGKKRRRRRLVYLLARRVTIPRRPARAIAWRQFRREVPWIMYRSINGYIRNKLWRKYVGSGK